jgi:hypothetical protein
VSGYAAVRAGSATFSWVVLDDEVRSIGLLLRVPPELRESVMHDMDQLVAMMQAADLEPEFTSQIVKLNRNSPPSVTVTWQGTVNDLTRATALLDHMVRQWRDAG